MAGAAARRQIDADSEELIFTRIVEGVMTADGHVRECWWKLERS
jgi:hypothetical protein